MNAEALREKIGLGEDKTWAVVGRFSDPHDLVAAGRKIKGDLNEAAVVFQADIAAHAHRWPTGDRFTNEAAV